jgi:type II secretory pathway pseudopilin PulG
MTNRTAAAGRLRTTTRRRSGLSLMEVLIALAIFLFSMVIIGRLIIMGGERALEVKLESYATRLCQSKLAEVSAGAIPLSGQGETPFDDDPNWVWSLEAEEADAPGLWRINIRVMRQQPAQPKIECAIRQLVLDPSLRGGTTAATPAGTDTPTTPDTSATSGSSKTGSGSKTGSTGGGGSSQGGSTGGSTKGGSTGGGSSKGKGGS